MTDNHIAVADSQARKTALVVACVLLATAAWNYHRGRMTVVYVTGIAGGALVLIGLLVPPLARRFHIYWMKLAGLLGWVNSRILLSLMFYAVFAPYGFISRLVGRDPLNRRGARRESYWTPRKTTRQTKEQFERLF
ncbi:MAG: SxtJ family membrane protein [Pyrinomonadaceae bacterium]